MRINPISAMQVRASNVSFKQNKMMSAPVQREMMEYPKGYMPYQISFASGYAKLPGIKLLKTVRDLPCLYCAQKMVSSNVIESLNVQNAKITRNLGEYAQVLQRKFASGENSAIINTIVNAAKKNPSMDSKDFIEGLEMTKKFVPDAVKKFTTRQMTGAEYAQKAINTIAEYEDGLMPVEKEVFQMIKDVFKQNPNQSVSEIMSTLRKSKLGGFETSQTKIINEIEQIAKESLSKQTRDKVLMETQRSKSLLTQSNSQYPFKRKKFIDILNRIPLNKQDVDGMAKILEKANSVPTSGSDTGAFIAKYTNKNVPVKGGFATRSDQEVIQRLLDPSRQSVEHIRPQMTFKTSNGSYTGPKDVIENLALAHKKCNSDRGHLTLEEYMNTVNPKARESIQKHIDFIIGEIKAGRLKGLEKYPEQLQETFSNETNGRLVLDIKDIKEYVEKFLAKKA